jgi:hypothetical protein
VIPILLAAAGVATGRLEVTVRKRTDPHFRPRRGDDESPDPGERLLVPDGRTVRSDIPEAAAGAKAPDSL